MAANMFHMVFFTSFAPLGWNTPWAGRVSREFRTPRYWADLARQLEDACFTGIVCEDECFIEDAYGNSTDFYVKYGMGSMKQDPSVLASIMLGATSRIGIVPTLNINEYHPYQLARLINTLDHMSAGRVGWNMVTGHSGAGARNYGMDDLPPHAQRYEMADEFIDVCKKLWLSWDADALQMDAESGIFADPAKVHAIDHKGKYYASKGPLNNSRSPQEIPVIFQAGASPAGRNFASKHANGLVGGMTGVAPMKEYRDDVRARAIGHGRSPDDVKAFYLCAPIIAASMAEAREREEQMKKAVAANMEVALVSLTLASGADFSGYPLDMPMSEIEKVMETNYGKSTLTDIFRFAGDMTLQEFIGMPPKWRIFMPTGTPEYVAGQMDELMQEVGGDGFLTITMGDHNRVRMAELTDGLMPALQKRGVVRKSLEEATFRENLLAF